MTNTDLENRKGWGQTKVVISKEHRCTEKVRLVLLTGSSLRPTVDLLRLKNTALLAFSWSAF